MIRYEQIIARIAFSRTPQVYAGSYSTLLVFTATSNVYPFCINNGCYSAYSQSSFYITFSHLQDSHISKDIFSLFKMKFSILTALTAIVGSAAAANQAVVKNDCSGTIYVQSWPYNGGAPGPLVALKPGKTFSENLRSTGSVRTPSLLFPSWTYEPNKTLKTVKIATTKTLSNPLFFGYSSTSKPNYVYYEFST